MRNKEWEGWCRVSQVGGAGRTHRVLPASITPSTSDMSDGRAGQEDAVVCSVSIKGKDRIIHVTQATGIAPSLSPPGGAGVASRATLVGALPRAVTCTRTSSRIL